MESDGDTGAVIATDGAFDAPDKGFSWTAPATGRYYIGAP